MKIHTPKSNYFCHLALHPSKKKIIQPKAIIKRSRCQRPVYSVTLNIKIDKPVAAKATKIANNLLIFDSSMKAAETANAVNEKPITVAKIE
jgi:hypothetical protein